MLTQMSPQSWSHDGFRLAYHTVGHPSSPPLLFIHGWTSYRGVWRETIEALKDRYYCVALDLLGHGDSDKPTQADYSIMAQGRRVLALADALGLKTFTLVGHSMGGQIALCIAALLAPARVVKTVDVAGVVTGRLSAGVERITYPQVAFCSRFPWLYRLARIQVRLRPMAQFYYGWAWFYDIRRVSREAWYDSGQHCFQPGMAVPLYHCSQAIHSLNLTPQLAQVQAPTLIIFGKHDNTVPLHDALLAQQHIPDNQLVLLDECGHFPMYEQTSAYLKAVSGFLTA
ncbi:MAG TPA: alpha/beta hydrolase [Phototrophicaceae bacterium]|nr:alpha/beta hydrolase [Phototrophicaceae bacterium]